VESPAVGDTRWLCEAAAATGTENKDRKRGDAFLKLEANRLAAFTGLSGETCYGRVGVVIEWRGSGVMKCAGALLISVLLLNTVDALEKHRQRGALTA
jgi:hypothetical protein